MEHWNEIVHTAMLGTGKKPLDSNSLPSEIAEPAARIQQQPLDAEDQYLQIAALAFNYRQCGVAALPKQNVITEKALPETVPYGSTQSLHLLAYIFNTGSISLLQLWLNACMSNQQIVQPDILPSLLEAAVRHKALRTAIVTCCGHRGRWLSNFNKAWQFGSVATDEDIWQTGTLEQRVQVLKQLRTTDTATARQWLQQTWPQEDAATKAELLPVLQDNISKEDLPFLESLMGEKSKKVKEIATELLRLIPESAIVQLYWQVLKETVQLKKEKLLLGLASKTKLIIELPKIIDEQVFRSGIEKLSKDAKKQSDDEYVIQQLIQRVPPHFWEEHLAESKEIILNYFKSNDQAKQFIQAFGFAAILFKNASWLQAIIKGNYTDQIYLQALELFPDDEKENYAMQILSTGSPTTSAVIHELTTHSSKEWSMELTRQLLPNYIMKSFMLHTKDFYNQNIHLIPVGIINELDKMITNTENQNNNYRSDITAHFINLLQLKQQISQSFNFN